MKFPGDRLASFVTSFGAADTSEYRVVGTKGDVRMEPAYSWHGELTQYVTVGERTKQTTFKARDQIAPEIVYFSNCVLNDEQPEPDGVED